MNLMRRFWADEAGTETVEWAIMIGLIAVAAVGLIFAIGQWVVDKFSKLESALQSASATT